MMFRRTPLVRKTRIRTVSPRATVVRHAYRQTRLIVEARALGRCEMCGDLLSDDWEVHHRQPRGMGGSNRNPRTYDPANCLASCGPSGRWCNQRIERADMWRTALEAGWRLLRNAIPAAEPVWYRNERWVYLDTNGGLSEARSTHDPGHVPAGADALKVARKTP